jgi:sodium-coupled neutral amino acid transporter 11
MALSGFLVFTDKTQANILNNFPQADLLINIARLCFGLNMYACPAPHFLISRL